MEISITTTAELITLLQQHNSNAFDTLYNNYSGALYSVIYDFVNNKVVADDLLQVVFIKVWKNINRYDETKASLFTWMVQIARNTSIDYVRSRRHQKDKLTSSIYSISSDDHCCRFNPDTIGIKKLIYRLPEKYRVVLLLNYFKGYTCPEIAIALSLPGNTIKTRKRIGLVRLKKMI